MALTEVEKCAGRLFRGMAEQVLAVAWTDFPDCAPCSPQVSFFRHECSAAKGRTRAVLLRDMTLVSPEIWVSWENDKLMCRSPREAQQRMEEGVVAEYETVLAGKFEFTWKQGKCGRCQLTVLSREGVLKDARPAFKIKQGDLAAYGGSGNGGIDSFKREGDLI
jgi:hypothetical protein